MNVQLCDLETIPYLWTKATINPYIHGWVEYFVIVNEITIGNKQF